MSPGRRDVPFHAGESAADEARQALGLGLDAPISVLDAVEDLAGIPVCVQEFAEDVAGLYYRRRGRAFLFVNGAHPVVRQRFTLAHEFGHERMGHSPRVESAAGMASTDPQEVQANYFAGAFLAPRQAVRNWAERHAQAADLELVVRMGAFFGLSAEASRIRLQLAGVIAKAESARLKERIVSREHYGLLEELGLSRQEDALSRLKSDVQAGARALPRLPVELVRGAREANVQGLVDDEDLETLLRSGAVGVRVDATNKADNLAETSEPRATAEAHIDLEGAEAAYRRADERGDPAGAIGLGTLLRERGDLVGAEAAYRRADVRGDPIGSLKLANLLERRGDLAGAEAAARRADERGDYIGSLKLASLLERRGDLAGAETVLQRIAKRISPRNKSDTPSSTQGVR